MIGAVSTVVALFLIQRIFILPFINKLDNMSIRIKAEEEKLERALYLNSQKGNIESVYEKISPYVETGETGEGTFSIIMKQIEEMAKDCGITLVNMKPETVEERGKQIYKLRSVSLTIDGDQGSITLFLYKIENSNYPMRINKIDLKTKGLDRNLMTASLDVYVIYFM